MTPQELAALPKGALVALDLKPDIGYDYGVVVLSGAVCYIKWETEVDGEDAPTSIIFTEDKAWARFIEDMHDCVRE